MDRRANRKILFALLVGMTSLWAVGCGHTEGDLPALSGEPDVRAATNPPLVELRRPSAIAADPGSAPFLAPALLTAPEIAQAEPLLVPTKPCEYRDVPPPSWGQFSSNPVTIHVTSPPAYTHSTNSGPSRFSPFPPVTDDATPSGPMGNGGPWGLNSSRGSSMLTIPWPTEIGTAATAPRGTAAPIYTARNSTPSFHASPSTSDTTSADLDVARRQADESLRRGFALAERGALFSAKSEITQALRHLAQALDAAHGTALHTRSLASGLRALQEADDFVPKGSRIETQLPLKVLIASHQTPILKGCAEDISPSAAVRAYYEFAQERLAVSLDREPIGSLALFALAKIQLAPEKGTTSGNPAGSSRAIALHRAATNVEPKNFLAANELGVLLARQGRWQEARAILEYSISISPQVVTYQNLASVFQNMGEGALAGQMQQAATLLAAQSGASATTGTSPAVQWLDTATFAQSSASLTDADATPRSGTKPAQLAQKPAQQVEDKRGAAGFFPWNQPRRN